MAPTQTANTVGPGLKQLESRYLLPTRAPRTVQRKLLETFSKNKSNLNDEIWRVQGILFTLVEVGHFDDKKLHCQCMYWRQYCNNRLNVKYPNTSMWQCDNVTLWLCDIMIFAHLLWCPAWLVVQGVTSFMAWRSAWTRLAGVGSGHLARLLSTHIMIASPFLQWRNASTYVFSLTEV